MKVYLNYESRVEVTRQGSGRWGGKDTETDYYNITLSAAKLGYEYEVLEIPSSIVGEVYYCYAIYSTGDSFSSHVRGGIELLFVTDNHDEALEAYKQLLQKNGGESYSIQVTLNGRPTTIYQPWFGYFETLERLELEVGYI